MEAAEDLKRKICAFVASKLDVTPDAIEVADGKAFNRNHPDQAFTMKDIGAAANLAEGLIMVGAGAWQQDPVHGHDPVTGELPLESVISFGCRVVEVEVDTETGEVDVNKLVQVWEVGKAINPLLVRQQINGGMQIGLGFALMENMYPYYPEQEITARNLSEYIMPTFMDYPKELIHGIEEVPHPMGVKGAKGFAEGSTSAPPAAIISAIHDAIGVWSPMEFRPRRKWFCAPWKPGKMVRRTTALRNMFWDDTNLGGKASVGISRSSVKGEAFLRRHWTSTN